MRGIKRNKKDNKDADNVGLPHDNVMPYEIFPRDQIYNGMTYSDLVENWFNWFLCTDADKHTLAPVVFLKSVGLPKDSTGTKGSETVDGQALSVTYPDDLYYPRKYSNDPNVRVGNDRLQIYTDQAVFVPIIVAYWVASKPFHDFGLMQEFNGLTIDYGDNPPGKDQFKIYDFKTDISPNRDLNDFRISTPIFTAVVPESEYGRSLKDFLEESILPGHYPAMVEGYFVLIKFNEETQDGKNYFVHTWARAPRETGGPYFSELLYEIEVKKRPEREIGSRGAPGFRLARNEGAIAKLLSDKLKSGEVRSSVGKRIRIVLGYDPERTLL